MSHERSNGLEFPRARRGYAVEAVDDYTAQVQERFTILKGDLNYRRLVGDRHWPASASFEQLTSYFPGAVAALRTVKSDVVVGLAEDAERTLPASWRTSGSFAMIQVRG